jgi:hypothetical protein
MPARMDLNSTISAGGELQNPSTANAVPRGGLVLGNVLLRLDTTGGGIPEDENMATIDSQNLPKFGRAMLSSGVTGDTSNRQLSSALVSSAVSEEGSASSKGPSSSRVPRIIKRPGLPRIVQLNDGSEVVSSLVDPEAIENFSEVPERIVSPSYGEFSRDRDARRRGRNKYRRGRNGNFRNRGARARNMGGQRDFRLENPGAEYPGIGEIYRPLKNREELHYSSLKPGQPNVLGYRRQQSPLLKRTIFLPGVEEQTIVFQRNQSPEPDPRGALGNNQINRPLNPAAEPFNPGPMILEAARIATRNPYDLGIVSLPNFPRMENFQFNYPPPMPEPFTQETNFQSDYPSPMLGPFAPETDGAVEDSGFLGIVGEPNPGHSYFHGLSPISPIIFPSPLAGSPVSPGFRLPPGEIFRMPINIDLSKFEDGAPQNHPALAGYGPPASKINFYHP